MLIHVSHCTPRCITGLFTARTKLFFVKYLFYHIDFFFKLLCICLVCLVKYEYNRKHVHQFDGTWMRSNIVKLKLVI